MHREVRERERMLRKRHAESTPERESRQLQNRETEQRRRDDESTPESFKTVAK